MMITENKLTFISKMDILRKERPPGTAQPDFI